MAEFCKTAEPVQVEISGTGVIVSQVCGGQDAHVLLSVDQARQVASWIVEAAEKIEDESA